VVCVVSQRGGDLFLLSCVAPNDDVNRAKFHEVQISTHGKCDASSVPGALFVRVRSEVVPLDVILSKARMPSSDDERVFANGFKVRYMTLPARRIICSVCRLCHSPSMVRLLTQKISAEGKVVRDRLFRSPTWTVAHLEFAFRIPTDVVPYLRYVEVTGVVAGIPNVRMVFDHVDKKCLPQIIHGHINVIENVRQYRGYLQRAFAILKAMIANKKSDDDIYNVLRELYREHTPRKRLRLR